MPDARTLLARATLHRHRPVRSEHAHAQVHGDHALGRFNAWLAVKVTNVVGTMLCAYLFVAVALVSFPQALQALGRGDMVTAVGWFSQSLVQLVLLPVIIVSQRVAAEAADRRAEADHETLSLLHEMNTTQLAILEELRGRGAP